jgi:transcriptional regulator with XRE-family HTH domain
VKKTVHSKQARELAALLRKARETAGFTQKQLADLLQRPQSFIAKYELGERRIDVIEFLAIARVLNVDPLRIIRALL